MTSASERMKPKHSRGFTIDSIIGHDTDAQSEKCTKSFGRYGSAADSSTKHLYSGRSSDSDCEHFGESERMENNSKSRLLQDTTIQGKDGHIHSDTETSKLRRTSPVSNHTDSLRHLNYSNTHIREGIRTSSSPDTLRHLHEHFIQNAKIGSGLGIPLGSFETQRQLRHPLATVTMGEYPPQMPMGPHVHPMLLNGARDLRHMYPYIADRYPGYFMPRYGMSVMPGLYFQPYRKPKRIRTAFSPSQLLQLERSFEKSHYVVGQERKDLANELQLTETQVKVWFQNRRTKYKRTKSDLDGEPTGEGHEAKSPYSDSKSESDISDTEDIEDVGEEYSNAHIYHQVIQTC